MQTVGNPATTSRPAQMSSVERVEYYLSRIETYNPALNAVVTLDAEGALAQARQADQTSASGETLHGVPITVKDSFDTKGMRTTAGYKPFSERVPAEDALLVSRLRQAGAIIMGKTNLPALASGIQANNPVFGRTNNPWDLSRTPGGSSGGAAAAIAADLTALELGSDIGGSIRIPAHFCGVYGLKMTGQVRLGKGHVSSPKPLNVSEQVRKLLDIAAFGPLARSVDDLRLAFSVLADWAEGEPPAPQPASLRIAYTDDFGGTPLAADSRAAMDRAAERLRQAGHQVARTVPSDFDFDDAWELAGEVLGCVNNAFQSPLVQGFRRVAGLMASNRKNVHPLMRGLYRGVTLSQQQIADALRRRDALTGQIERFLGEWDVWICPVFPTSAFTHRSATDEIDVDGQPMPQLMANLLHPIIFNLSGHPAVVIPVGFTHDNLPIGVQLIGRRFAETQLLDAAQRIDGVLQAYRCPPGY